LQNESLELFYYITHNYIHNNELFRNCLLTAGTNADIISDVDYSVWLHFSRFDEIEVMENQLRIASLWSASGVLWEKKKGANESFARIVKCRECSEAGRTISSVIKVMRYLVRAAEYGTAASIMEKSAAAGSNEKFSGKRD